MSPSLVSSFSVHNCVVVLSKGTFTTPIAAVDSKVEYKIRNNYEVRATFRSQGSDYEFIMNRWTKTAADVKKPVSTFDKFAQLILDRYSEDTTLFGNITTTGNSTSYNYGQTEIINMLKYSMRQVFICAEEIILTHRRTLLDYAIYHREHSRYRNPGTYEEYIHLVACHCLVHSNYLAPGIQYPVVEYADTAQGYRGDNFLDSMIDEGVTKD